MLTSRGLSYSKSRNDPPLCEIPTSELLAVERVDDQAFNMKFVSRLCVCWFVGLFVCFHSPILVLAQMFQVIQPSRVLYVQAKNSLELKEWYVQYMMY